MVATGSIAAVDAVAIAGGSGDGARVARAAVELDWPWQRQLWDRWKASGYWDLSLGAWRVDRREGGRRTVWDLGVTPTLKVEYETAMPVRPYAEVGIGGHLLSHTIDNDKIRLSTAFEFSEHAGVGVRFGDRGQYDLVYRWQHLSNGGIKRPNSGVNYNLVRFRYHF